MNLKTKGRWPSCKGKRERETCEGWSRVRPFGYVSKQRCVSFAGIHPTFSNPFIHANRSSDGITRPNPTLHDHLCVHLRPRSTGKALRRPFPFATLSVSPLSLGLFHARSDSLCPCSFATILFSLPSLVFSLPPIVLSSVPSFLLPLWVVRSHLPRFLPSSLAFVSMSVVLVFSPSSTLPSLVTSSSPPSPSNPFHWSSTVVPIVVNQCLCLRLHFVCRPNHAIRCGSNRICRQNNACE